ncbi:hypothetical protein ABIE66_002011 [Peribacillus sp. B2I2]|uniref:hypothetical protein n=1 Tax=Peribacillus sp. B2I2 TaxID=3156468 RepID=UPI0035199064
MDMINIFNAPKNAFNDMLFVNGQEFYHNGLKRYGIITNPEIKEFNDKYVSTDYKLMRGDYIYYDSMYWMVWNQVTIARAENFKGIMRQAEHDVIFNLYYAGVTTDYLLKCPAIISRTSDYTLESSDMMTMVDAEVHIFVRDTASTRRIMDLTNKTDGQVIVGERNYDITGISFEKKGYLDITAKIGTRNSSSDYDNNIYWNTSGKPADWADQFDLTFFQREGQAPVRPSVPDNYHTSVTLTQVSPTAYTSEQMGSIALTWTAEGNKDVYADFNGYKVRLLQGTNEIKMSMLDASTLTHSFNGLNIGTYTVEVYAVFGSNNTILPVTATVEVADGDAPVVTPDTQMTNVTMRAYNDSNSYGTLVWDREVQATAFEGYTLYGYRVEVWTSSMFGGDSMQDYWVTTTESQDIRTGWSGEMGWFVTIKSIFHTETGEQLMQPHRISGDDLTALPDEYYPSPW